MEDDKLAKSEREQMSRKWRERRRSMKTDNVIWKEWEENGEKQQTWNELETVDRKRSERKVRRRKKGRRNYNSYHGNPTPDDRDN